MLQEANAWDCPMWGNDQGFFAEIVGVVGATVMRGRLTIACLDRLPYIICHLGFVEGARERILEQYASAPREQHHRVSRSLCDPGELLDAMMSMRDYRDLDNESLRMFVVAKRELPINDEVCERPHAEFAKEHQHAPASGFPWKAASVRLQQNLDDVPLMASCTGDSLQAVYDSCKRVIQTSAYKRSVRCRRKVLKNVFIIVVTSSVQIFLFQNMTWSRIVFCSIE